MHYIIIETVKFVFVIFTYESIYKILAVVHKVFEVLVICRVTAHYVSFIRIKINPVIELECVL
jgi:hypothetical protein